MKKNCAIKTELRNRQICRNRIWIWLAYAGFGHVDAKLMSCRLSAWDLKSIFFAQWHLPLTQFHSISASIPCCLLPLAVAVTHAERNYDYCSVFTAHTMPSGRIRFDIIPYTCTNWTQHYPIAVTFSHSYASDLEQRTAKHTNVHCVSSLCT